MKNALMVTAVLLCACASKPPVLGDSAEGKIFAPLAFMVGDWDGQPGASGHPVGSFSLTSALQTHVLYRNGFKIDGTSVVEDHMVIYLQGNDIRADYYDNLGHVLRYQVYPQPQNKIVVFESNPGSDGAIYRATYHSLDDDTIEVKFDQGHAGSDFQPYLNGTMKRRKK
jgi:hypothetical protein